MGTTIFLEEINLLSILLLFLVPLLLIHILKQTKFVSSKLGQNLPPGPFQWPILGNIPNIIGQKPHVIVTKLAKIHGELISLKLGKQIVIIGSSPKSASAILKTHDRELSARYAPKATPIKESDLRRFSLLWSAECTGQWKSIRVLWKSELFSNKALEKQVEMRKRKVGEMMDFLMCKEGKVVKIADVVFAAVFRTLGMLCFSRDLIELEDEELASELKDTFWRFMEHSTTPIVPDFFPVFEGFDPQGQKKKAKECLNRLFDIWRGVVKERRERFSLDGPRNGDFLDFMLTNGFSDIQIDYMLLEIIPAGLGTLTTTVEWAMAELLKNKEAMTKLHKELQIVINSFPIRESQVFHLPYLNSCIKETLRLHPPIPFLPHCANETCQVMNYTIPKNSLVFVNVWALGHDPMTWDDPFVFKPERFLNINLDFKGQDFEFLPFGAGRRMCPGLPFAAKEVHLILASLIFYFKWSLPNDADVLQLDMNEKYAIPLRKEQPLLLVPSRIDI